MKYYFMIDYDNSCQTFCASQLPGSSSDYQFEFFTRKSTEIPQDHRPDAKRYSTQINSALTDGPEAADVLLAMHAYKLVSTSRSYYPHATLVLVHGGDGGYKEVMAQLQANKSQGWSITETTKPLIAFLAPHFPEKICSYCKIYNAEYDHFRLNRYGYSSKWQVVCGY
eukprot:TRINITY_DN67243_c4_g1_i1.p1 TRINITY_DN67243_c4_g1~~TRINITY_DN67243_c4_g1_i1.p1  ORF type:complete len:168 (-),score=5.98 TRINITY_DN67243_c4_g1_i1:77-580(-)